MSDSSPDRTHFEEVIEEIKTLSSEQKDLVLALAMFTIVRFIPEHAGKNLKQEFEGILTEEEKEILKSIS